MKALDKWHKDRASLDLDYNTAKELWQAARKRLKRKLRKLRKQQNQDKLTLVRPIDINQQYSPDMSILES